jgi:hypothetical protein
MHAEQIGNTSQLQVLTHIVLQRLRCQKLAAVGFLLQQPSSPRCDATEVFIMGQA